MRARVAPAIVVLILLAGCGGGADDDASTAPEPVSTDAPESAPPTEAESSPSPTSEAPTTAPEPTAEATQDPAPPAVPDALDFSAAAVGGGTFDARELAGSPVVFWFWAPWCPVCQGEAPLIAGLAQDYAGQVEFVGVAGLSGDLDAIEGFVTDHDVDAFPHIDDRDGAVYTRFGVTQQYDLGVVTAEGDVDILRGPLDEQQITDAVADLAAG